MSSWAMMFSLSPPIWGKLRIISFCFWLLALSSSVRSATFLGCVKCLWKVRKLTPEVHTARERSRDASSTPLCCMFCHSFTGRSRGCGAGRVGSGWPSSRRSGSVCLGGRGAPSAVGVEGVPSFTTMLARLRFNDALAALPAVSFGVSGSAGAASSRARALVDRRGSDIACATRAQRRAAPKLQCEKLGWDLATALQPTRRASLQPLCPALLVKVHPSSSAPTGTILVRSHKNHARTVEHNDDESGHHRFQGAFKGGLARRGRHCNAEEPVPPYS